MLITIFIISGFMILLPYVFYPLVVAVLARLRKPLKPSTDHIPHVSVVVVCYNEETQIVGKLRTILDLDYPQDKLHIIVASDGSSDNTMGAARSVKDPRIDVYELDRRRRGKAGTINRLLPFLKGEEIFFTDVRQQLHPQSLRRLVGYFVNPKVGCVSGKLVIRDPLAGDDQTNNVGLYWKLEVFIRTMESRLFSTVGVSGCIYAVRRDLLDVLPETAILDDVVIPMNIHRKGYRIVYEPSAEAYDMPMTSEQEARRKRRTLAGNYQMIFRPRMFGHPFKGWMGWMFFSHKVSRLLVPWFVVMHFAMSVSLASGLLGWAWVGVQGAGFAAAGLCAVLRRFGIRPRFLGIPYTFCRLNFVAVSALVAYYRGTAKAAWESTTPYTGPDRRQKAA